MGSKRLRNRGAAHAHGSAVAVEPRSARVAEELPRFNPILLVILCLIVLACYANVIPGPFIFDDHFLLEDNALISSMRNLPILFSSDLFARSPGAVPISNSYRPLQTTTYAMDYALWKGKEHGFHISNILLHMATVMALFLLMRRISGDPAIAFFVAAIFGVHPVNTSCVSYLSGRADVMSALFMIISLLLYVRYTDSGKISILAASVLSYLAAIFSKEYAIVALPMSILLYNAVFKRDELLKPRSYAAYGVALLVYIPLRLRALEGFTPIALELSRIDMPSRVMTSVKTLFIDLRILFLPYDLHFGRTTGVERSIFGSVPAFLTVAGIVCAAVILWRLYREWVRRSDALCGRIFFGLSWFFLMMIPLLNIVPLQVFHADNWLYYPSIGIYLAAGAILAWLVGAAGKESRAMRKVIAGLVCIGIVSYGAVTVRRNMDYRDEARFFLSSVKWRPNVKFYNALSVVYGKRGEIEKARYYAEKAVETNLVYPSPEVYNAYINLGISYFNLHDYRRALETFRKVLGSGMAELEKTANKYLAIIGKMK